MEKKLKKHVKILGQNPEVFSKMVKNRHQKDLKQISANLNRAKLKFSTGHRRVLTVENGMHYTKVVSLI